MEFSYGEDANFNKTGTHKQPCEGVVLGAGVRCSEGRLSALDSSAGLHWYLEPATTMSEWDVSRERRW